MADTNLSKDIIYIDVDDEITTVIDKLQQSDSKIVALVLPKRAAAFQSVVNMRLLKRSAANAKKNIVLITSEPSLLPLAGIAGLHVAKSAQSKPIVPDVPNAIDSSEIIDESVTDATQLAAGPSDNDTIEVDNDSLENIATVTTKQSFNKKLKVPNFDSFRAKVLIGGVLLLVLIVAGVFATMILPKATITIKTNTTDLASTLLVTTSPAIKEVNSSNKSVPGIAKELKKTDSQKAATTGQKDMGTKATGKVTLTTQISCSSAQPATVPAGTPIVADNYTFIMDTASNFTFTGETTGSPPNVKCTWKTAAIPVTAQNAGDQYNLSARPYTVTGFSNVSGAGGIMSGGTSKVVRIVSQQDVDTLRQKILEGLNSTATAEITAQLKDGGYFPLPETFSAGDPLVVPSPAVNTESAEVTVNVTVTYTMSGAKQDGLTKLLEEDIKRQIDIAKQNILDNGLNQATIRIEENKPDGTIRFTLQTTAKVGVEQNEEAVKKAVAGKKKGEAKSIIQSRPGVRDVTIDTSPFWVSKIPSKQQKVTIIFEQQKL